MYVDGQCHYWVQEPDGGDKFIAWRSYREGVLTEAQESRLHDRVSYDRFDGLPRCRQSSSVDAGLVEVADNAQSLGCYGFSSEESDWPMRGELFASGEDVSGPMRVVVGQNYVLDTAQLYAWPLSSGVVSYEVPYSDAFSFGVSKLVSAPADLAGLRELRRTAIADAERGPGNWFGAVLVEPRGYQVAIRDHLPFTDESSGLWEAHELP